jgi:hypothetical protein
MVEMSKKQIPEGITHTPNPIAWAQLTPLSEHKEREAASVELTVIDNGTKREPLPLSRATTDLRKAYPYIFDCVSYALTHNPEKVETDEFYSRFTMPYNVFLDYCLDDCVEQTQYLKEELYHLFKGQPAKYIKVSEHRSVYAQPVIIAFSHTDPQTLKEKTIKNIGKDKLVDMVQVQIIKELLTFDHGFLNQPKAFYAKIRRIFNEAKQIFDRKCTLPPGGRYREIITHLKKEFPYAVSVEKLQEFYNLWLQQQKQLGTFEQGGFYAVYLALEYILANKKRGIREQRYNLLELCAKCNPSLTQIKKDGTLYFHNAEETKAFMGILTTFATAMSNNRDIAKAIGIEQIYPDGLGAKELTLVVVFGKHT